MKLWVQAAITLLVLSISACSSIQVPEQQINQNNHQLKLSQLSEWKIKGKLAFKSAEEKFSANVNWRQNQQAFSLRLSSFVGSTLMTMEGDQGFAQINADDKQYTDTDASRLIYRVTGWNIPVGKLALWVKGQHEQRDIASYDEFGLLQSLQPSCRNCQIWKLKYDKYQSVNGVWLPHQITLLNTQDALNQIKIRIYEWQTLQN